MKLTIEDAVKPTDADWKLGLGRFYGAFYVRGKLYHGDSAVGVESTVHNTEHEAVKNWSEVWDDEDIRNDEA